MKEKQKNMELNIMCCVLMRPELMEQIEIEDREFTNFKRLWRFLKTFYNKFETFDIELMASVCNDKYQIIEYVQMILERQATTVNFKKYQKALLDLNHKKKLEDFFTDKAYEYVFELGTSTITSDEFIEKINELYEKIQKLP